MSARLFLAAVEEVIDPPCTKYACARRSDCAAQELACESFVYYVKRGVVVHPAMVFKKSKNGWRPSNQQLDAPTPTAELFVGA